MCRIMCCVMCRIMCHVMCLIMCRMRRRIMCHVMGVRNLIEIIPIEICTSIKIKCILIELCR